MKVGAKRKDDAEQTVVEFACPETLDAMIEAYGHELVFNAAKGSIVISLQSYIRRLLTKGSSPDAIAEAVAAWRPDVRAIVKQSAFDKVSGEVEKLTAEERAALLERLMAAE
jgi:hypothetical protein